MALADSFFQGFNAITQRQQYDRAQQERERAARAGEEIDYYGIDQQMARLNTQIKENMRYQNAQYDFTGSQNDLERALKVTLQDDGQAHDEMMQGSRLEHDRWKTALNDLTNRFGINKQFDAAKGGWQSRERITDANNTAALERQGNQIRSNELLASNQLGFSYSKLAREDAQERARQAHRQRELNSRVLPNGYTVQTDQYVNHRDEMAKISRLRAAVARGLGSGEVSKNDVDNLNVAMSSADPRVVRLYGTEGLGLENAYDGHLGGELGGPAHYNRVFNGPDPYGRRGGGGKKSGVGSWVNSLRSLTSKFNGGF